MRIFSQALLAVLVILLPGTMHSARALPPATAGCASLGQPTVQEPSEDGETLYEAHCRGCHGAQGQGRYGTDLALVLVSVDPQRYARSSIEMGVPGTTMPTWGKRFGGPLSDADLDALASFGVELAHQRRAGPDSTSSRQPHPPLQDLRHDIAAPIVLLAILAGGIALVAWTLRNRLVHEGNRR
jgi:mono/diheme cytochrome c family protein